MATKRLLTSVAMGVLFLFSLSAASVAPDTISVINSSKFIVKSKDGKLIYDSNTNIVPESEVKENIVSSLEEAAAAQRESLFPESNFSLAGSHFTWGAEFGSSIDCSYYDMTTFDFDAFFGFKNSFIKILGVGAGIRKSVTGGNTFIPVYLTFRTSFRKKPSLFFLNLQGGYSFNTMPDSEVFGDYVGTLGIGINLSQKRLVKSYIVLSAGYYYFNDIHREYAKLDRHSLFLARMALGIDF